ncbi:MAG: hypothetical protein IT198_00985 [Acidimicrobiia bacterium]|nr:hypothetical protein [Acidimicrobiia bacterium]
MIDQAASSLTNYAVLFAALHSLDVEGVGAFTLAYTSALVGVSLVRALAIEPLVIRFTGADAERGKKAAADAIGSSLAIGLAGSAVLLGAAGLSSGVAASVLAGLAPVLPVILVQDAWRWYLVAVGRAWAATLNDGVCLVTTVGVSVAVLVSGRISGPGGLLVCWTLGLGVGAVLGIFQSGVIPHLLHARAWVRDNKDLGGRLAGEKGVASVGPQLALMLVGVLVSIEAVGEIGAALTVLAPVTTATSSIALFAVPEAVKLREYPRALKRLAAVMSIGTVAVTASYAACVMFGPAWIGGLLAGDNWAAARAIFVPVAVWVGATGARQGPSASLRAMERGRTLVRLAAMAAGLVLAGSAAGSVIGGTSGAVWGFATAGLLALAAMWWALLRVLAFLRSAEPAAR